MGKKYDYAYLDGVGLFESRAAAEIYGYFCNNAQDGVTEPIEWTRLRDALFGDLSFMEHDDLMLFEIEIINPSLAEIRKRTGNLIEMEELESLPGSDALIRFAQRKD